MLINEGHQQAPPILPPAWHGDIPLQGLLRRILPAHIFSSVDAELSQFQQRLAGSIHEAAVLADGKNAEPRLVQYNQYGQRCDRLETSEGWRLLKRISAVERAISLNYDRATFGEFARVFGLAKTYLMYPEGRYIGCPLSMTDGAARLLELYGTDEMKATVLPRLLSDDPNIAWTAGQWMTEKPGGSDVSLTETVARPLDPSRVAKAGDEFILDGFKWFSSATDGDIALALARTGPVGSGSRGLSLFLIKLRDENGKMNGIRIHRLKKKWGTKALPTAELELSNCRASLIGELGRGVPIIATVLNITRIHSGLSGVGALRRAIHLATAFARVRHIGGVNGSMLAQNELHTSEHSRHVG